MEDPKGRIENMTCNRFLFIFFQASFNYPSRQPSFKQNSSEADSQPDLLLQPSSSGGHLGTIHKLRHHI